jgi:hypothetical protein
MTDLINNLIFAGLNIAMAFHHARLIKQNRPIRHGLWACAYMGAVVLSCVVFTWWYLPILVLNRAVIFSPVLNLRRGLPVNYISSSTTSVIDKLESRLFGRNWYKKMAWYIGLFILCLLIKALL